MVPAGRLKSKGGLDSSQPAGSGVWPPLFFEASNTLSRREPHLFAPSWLGLYPPVEVGGKRVVSYCKIEASRRVHIAAVGARQPSQWLKSDEVRERITGGSGHLGAITMSSGLASLSAWHFQRFQQAMASAPSEFELQSTALDWNGSYCGSISYICMLHFSWRYLRISRASRSFSSGRILVCSYPACRPPELDAVIASQVPHRVPRLPLQFPVLASRYISTKG